MAYTDEWAQQVLAAFNIRQSPTSPAARISVAKFIVGKMGWSRKPPGDRAAMYQTVAERFMGKRIRDGAREGTVKHVLVRHLDQRVAIRTSQTERLGPFAASVYWDNGGVSIHSVYSLDLIEPESTPE